MLWVGLRSDTVHYNYCHHIILEYHIRREGTAYYYVMKIQMTFEQFIIQLLFIPNQILEWFYSTKFLPQVCWLCGDWCHIWHKFQAEYLKTVNKSSDSSQSRKFCILPTHSSLSLRCGTSFVTNWQVLKDSRLQVSSGLS